ncbi:MAG: hypothetical protein IJ397_09955 [Lachnospiraceae bacterium]|nr:hypothetical protein [Lachnospiraceae bacterium]
MTQLLVIREQLKKLCGKYEVYLVPIGKFLASLITFLIINANLGYMEKVAKFPIALILALLCSFLPVNFIIICGALLSLLHVYALSMECAIIVGVIYLLMFLLYFRFSPKDTFVVILTPICCVLQIPYAIPLSLGLVGTPASVVSVGCGVVVYHILRYIKESANALSALDADGMMAKFKYLIDGIIGNKEMFVMVIAFAVTVILVYVVRRMNIDYAWTIAIIVGGLADILILLIGDLMYTTNISILGVILGSALAFGVVKVLQFFVFNVDYARTERVQFEDDEYYYYVKAVPKITISTPEIKVKKVSGKSSSTAEKREQSREKIARTVSEQNEAARERTAKTTGDSGERTAARTGRTVSSTARTGVSATGSGVKGVPGAAVRSSVNTGTRSTASSVGTRSVGSAATRTVSQVNKASGAAGATRNTVGANPTEGIKRTYHIDNK